MPLQGGYGHWIRITGNRDAARSAQGQDEAQ
jgi:hypothetical protein